MTNERIARGYGGPSFYGDEVRGIPPSELFHQEDAGMALERAQFVFGCCQRLLGG